VELERHADMTRPRLPGQSRVMRWYSSTPSRRGQHHVGQHESERPVLGHLRECARLGIAPNTRAPRSSNSAIAVARRVVVFPMSTFAATACAGSGHAAGHLRGHRKAGSHSSIVALWFPALSIDRLPPLRWTEGVNDDKRARCPCPGGLVVKNALRPRPQVCRHAVAGVGNADPIASSGGRDSRAVRHAADFESRVRRRHRRRAVECEVEDRVLQVAAIRPARAARRRTQLNLVAATDAVLDEILHLASMSRPRPIDFERLAAREHQQPPRQPGR